MVSRTRAVLAGVVALVAMCAVVGAVGLWFDRAVFDPDGFSDAVGDVLERPDARDALAEIIVDSLVDEEPLVALFRGPAQRLFAGLLEHPVVAPLVDTAAAAIHEDLLSGRSDPVVLPLGVVEREVIEPLVGAVPALADVLPPLGDVVVLEEGVIPSVRPLSLVVSAAWPAALVLLLVVAVGVWLVSGAARALAALGVGLLVGAGVVTLLPIAFRFLVAGRAAEGPARLLLELGITQVTRPLSASALVLGGIGVVGVAAGALAGAGRDR